MRKKSSGAIILDSFSLIGYFRGEPQPTEEVKAVLRRAEDGKITIYLNLINWGEVAYRILREFGEEQLQTIIARLDQLPIGIIPVDRELVMAAARWKSRGGMSYADSFVLATAQKLGGEILTGDPEFKLVEKEVSVIWIGKRRTNNS